jgi:uncharacterized protein (TIGR02265 family)
MPNVKGTSIAARLDYVRRRGGEEAVAAILGELSDKSEVDQIRVTGPLKSAWYPFRMFVELIEAIDRKFGKGDGSLIEDLGAEVARTDLKTVYKVFYRIASPNFVVSKATQVWSRYYDSGELTVLQNDPGKVRIELRSFASPNKTHCQSVTGWMRETLHMSGAQECQVTHPRCRTRGDAICEYVATWKP